MYERFLVLGLGVTGDAVVRYARELDAQITVIEDAPGGAAYAERVADAAARGATVVEAPAPGVIEDLVAAADVLVPSPGVPARHPAFAAARATGVPVRAEIDLAAERLGSTPLVAVTGTNGKTTVTTLVAAMLVASGIDATAAGNIGVPLLDAAAGTSEVVVAEVSSFQLAFTTEAFRPRVAVLLNLAEDHLDWHDSFADYTAAKARVFAHQSGDDVLVFNADDARVARLATAAPARRMPFSVADVDTGDTRGHANARAATLAAGEVGGTPAGTAAALGDFEGLPHRMQLVGEHAGVHYFDDSKATNPHATLAGVEAAAGPVVLIAGGRNKGLDLSVLRKLAPRLRGVVAIGDARGEIAGVFAELTPVVEADDMRAAVTRAAEQAEPGDVVILSPACASFDWYASYGARGDDFAREVERLRARDGPPLERQVTE
ncbi:MAG: UDP-N-acetylmuramoyl-L-alanine--D-glutamate ligase [Actinomycetota bacterium]